MDIKNPSKKKQAKLDQKNARKRLTAVIAEELEKARKERLAAVIESTCDLLNGSKLVATMRGGAFEWALDGVAIDAEGAKHAMMSEERNEWVFVAADGKQSTMRRATPEELAKADADRERAEWNARVEARRVVA